MPAYPCPTCQGRKDVVVVQMKIDGSTVAKRVPCPNCKGRGWI